MRPSLTNADFVYRVQGYFELRATRSPLSDMQIAVIGTWIDAVSEPLNQDVAQIKSLLAALKLVGERPEYRAWMSEAIQRELDGLFEHDAGIPYGARANDVLVPAAEQAYMKVGRLSCTDWCYRVQGHFELQGKVQSEWSARQSSVLLEWISMLPAKVPVTMFHVIRAVRHAATLIDVSERGRAVRDVRDKLETHLREHIDPNYAGDPEELQAIHDGVLHATKTNAAT